MSNIGIFLHQIYAIVFLVIWFASSALIGYWLFFQPDNILSNVNSSAFVNGNSSNKVIAGETMIVDRSFCINDDKIKGEVTRTFTNHVVYQLPDTSSLSIGKGTGCREKQYVIDVPLALPSGEYEYRVHITYRLNPLRTVTYSLTPIPLQVVNPVWDRVKELAKEKK